MTTLKQIFSKDTWIQEFPQEWPEECFNCNIVDCKPADFEKRKRPQGVITSDMIGKDVDFHNKDEDILV